MHLGDGFHSHRKWRIHRAYLYFHKFRYDLDFEQCGQPKLGWHCLIGGRRHIGGGRHNVMGFFQWWHLYFTDCSRARIEYFTSEQQSRALLAHSFHKFCLAAECGFNHNRLGDADKYTHAQFRQPAKSSHAFTLQQQRFLSAGDAIGFISSSTPPSSPPVAHPVRREMPPSFSAPSGQ